MDNIFKALNDPTRRHILDILREENGLTLSDIVSKTEMGRFGVMKHISVLEEAGLLATRKVGRFKHHYLNASQIQSVLDRWIEPFRAGPMARFSLDLKRQLEGETSMSKPDFVMETYIKTTAQKLWDALTQPDLIGQYYIMSAKPDTSILEMGPTSYNTADGRPLLSGTVLSIEEPKRLEMTFEPHWGENRQASRVVYEIEVENDLCKLSILHYALPAAQDGVKTGWARIISGLKTLLETGKPLAKAA